jgi:hypothetical protein
MGTLLNTKQAAQYLTERGKKTERSTLDTLRNLGGGPIFGKEDGKKPIWYDTDDLDEWAKSSPLKKYRSTSEYTTRARKVPRPNGAPPEDTPGSESGGSHPTPGDGEGE